MSGVSIFGARSVFDEFLHSTIRKPGTTASLTVLSLLAQNDVDPWDEAARYSRLPKAEAAMQLADLIAASADNSSPDSVVDSIALSLVMRLPPVSAVRPRLPGKPSGARFLELFRQLAGGRRD